MISYKSEKVAEINHRDMSKGEKPFCFVNLEEIHALK